MPIVSTLQIVGDGPTGTPVITIDKLGIKDVASGAFFNSYHYINYRLIALPLVSFVWVCVAGVWQVAAVNAAYTVIGTGSASVDVAVCPQCVAVASGTSQLTAVIDLHTTAAPANKPGTLIATPTSITVGDAVGVTLAATVTNLVGVLTIALKRVG